MSERQNSKPIGCPPEIWVAMVDLREAQRHLREYKQSNRFGQDYHVEAAEEGLKDAHNALSLWIDQIPEA